MASSTAARCPGCGHENNSKYKFCGMCGTALGAPPDASSRNHSSLTVGGYSILGLTESTQPTVTRDAPAAQNPRLPSYLAPQVAAEPVIRERSDGPIPGSRPPVNSPPYRSHDSDRSTLNLDYLFEGEEKKTERRWPIYIVIALLATVAGLVWQWQRNGYPWDDLTPLSAQDTQKLSAKPTAAVTPNMPADGTPETAQKPAAGVVPPAAKPVASPLETETAAHESNSAERGKPALQPALKPTSETDPAPAAQTEAKAEDSRESKNAETSVAEDSEGDTKTQDSSGGDDLTAAAPAPTAIPNEAASPEEAAQLLIEGSRYLLGNGVAQDCDRAQKDLRAASRFSSEADSMLGTMYASGHCVTRDLPTAYRWYARALHNKPDNTRIQNDLTVLWSQMTPAERRAASRTAN